MQFVLFGHQDPDGVTPPKLLDCPVFFASEYPSNLNAANPSTVCNVLPPDIFAVETNGRKRTWFSQAPIFDCKSELPQYVLED